jgi:hypothetical protein
VPLLELWAVRMTLRAEASRVKPGGSTPASALPRGLRLSSVPAVQQVGMPIILNNNINKNKNQ